MSVRGKGRSRLSSKLNSLVNNEESNISLKKAKIDKNVKDASNLFELSQLENIELLKNADRDRLGDEFFDEDCLSLSRKLLGKYLIRKMVVLDENDAEIERVLIGKIVECESYLGGDDKASHTYNGKCTDRLKAMYMKAGTAYVYNIYGMYCCLNISSREAGAGVLIRALEPISGVDLMQENRAKANSTKSDFKLKELTSGPSKLCLAMKISKNEFNEVDLCRSNKMWLQQSFLTHEKPGDFKIVAAKRVNIDYAGQEAINKLYRFYIKNNIHISVKCKQEIEYNENHIH